MAKWKNIDRADYIMRSQGNGYLKVPSQARAKVRDKVGKEIKDLAPPKVSFKLVGRKLKMKFEFDLDEEWDGDYSKDEYV